MRQDNKGNVEYYDRLAGVYDLFFHDLRKSMDEEGKWLSAILRENCAHDILDASCGTGRQAIPLAARGFRVAAADPSRPMLLEAQGAAAERQISLPTYQLAFDDLPRQFERAFDAVVAMGNGLCNLGTREDVARALTALHACCRQGGICIVGVKDFEALKGRQRSFEDHQILDRDGKRHILFEVWDVQEPQLVSTAFLLEGPPPGEPGDWETFAAVTHEYMLCREELVELSREAGFCCAQQLDHPSEVAYLLRA